jgi:hypothetical protein
MTTTRSVARTTVPAARTSEVLVLRPLRLQLRLRWPETASRAAGLVDGAWWPYTDDLAPELEPLLEEMARRGHVVHRISYRRGAWQPVPRKLQLAGALVRLGGYRTQPAAVIHLIETSGRPPLVLVVVPPATAPDAARRALQLAATSTSLDAAGVLDAAAA